MVEVINPWVHVDPRWGEMPLSHAYVCRPKQVMFMAGQVAEDPETKEIIGKGDFLAQYRQVHENIKRVLEAGGFSLRDVVKRAMFVSEEGYDLMQGQMEEMKRIGAEYFDKPYPPHSFWVAKRLAHPDYLLEIEVIAAKE